jgi:hypothetical protein
MFSSLKMVHGKLCHSPSWGKCIRRKPGHNKTCTRCPEGTIFVHLIKSTAYHDGIKYCPSQAKVCLVVMLWLFSHYQWCLFTKSGVKMIKRICLEQGQPAEVENEGKTLEKGRNK